jgi:hypothetical protein
MGEFKAQGSSLPRKWPLIDDQAVAKMGLPVLWWLDLGQRPCLCREAGVHPLFEE